MMFGIVEKSMQYGATKMEDKFKATMHINAYITTKGSCLHFDV